jgi:hypothetical protein
MERGLIHGASVYAVVPMTGRLKKKKHTHTHKTQKIVISLKQKLLLLLSSFSSTLFLINTMSTSGRSPSTVEQNATRQSGDDLQDEKSPDAEKNTTTPNQQRDSPTIQVTVRPTTNSAYMEDQQVLSHNSTERPTATYASTVHQQVMSQNNTTSPNSNVPVGKKKKGKIPDEQGLCDKKISSGSQEKTSDEQELHNSEGKSESKGEIPVEQVLQDNESSSESEENPSNEQKLQGC